MSSARVRRSEYDEVLARVAVLEATVAALVARPARAPIRANHEALLQCIADATGERPFTTRHLFRHLQVTGDETLKMALADAGVTSPRELGWCLHRAMRDGDGSVQRFDRGRRDGVIWQIVRR